MFIFNCQWITPYFIVVIFDVLSLHMQHHVQWYTWMLGKHPKTHCSLCTHNREPSKLASTKTLLEDFSCTSRQPMQAHKWQILPNLLIFITLNVSGCKGTWRLFYSSGMVKLKTLVIGLTQVERSQIHTHLPRRSPCLYSTDGQSMGPETAQLLTATSLHSKKIWLCCCFCQTPFTPNIAC